MHVYICIFIAKNKSLHCTSTEVTSELISHVHLCTVQMRKRLLKSTPGN